MFQNHSSEKLLTLTDVAEIVGIGRSKVYSLVKEGPYKLPHIRIGKQIRVRYEDLMAWIQSMSQ